ncbi:MAG: serine protease [Armatimonadota bacterium]
MKLWNRAYLLALIVLMLILGPAVVSIADDTASGRDIAAKYGPSIVKVQIILKLTASYMGSSDNQEQKIEVTGTVVDPSGLTVISMSSTDPADIMQLMYGDTEEMQIKSEVTDVKIRLADGKELPGKIVLRDKDLDLAFIRPVNKPSEPLPYLDITNNCKLDVLDQTVTVTRLGKVANRVISASIGRIQASVEKPRKFYTIGLNSNSSSSILGSPVFSMDGKVLGIVLLRVMQGQSKESLMSGGMRESPVIPAIIPAEDIAPIAAQAPEDAPKPAVKPADAKKPASAPAKTPAKAPAASHPSKQAK